MSNIHIYINLYLIIYRIYSIMSLATIIQMYKLLVYESIDINIEVYIYNSGHFMNIHCQMLNVHLSQYV